jgi:hypothetical protein
VLLVYVPLSVKTQIRCRRCSAHRPHAVSVTAGHLTTVELPTIGTVCWGTYLGLGGGTKQETGENYSFMVCTAQQTLLGQSNQGGWDGWGMWHVWIRRETHTGFGEKPWEKQTALKESPSRRQNNIRMDPKEIRLEGVVVWLRKGTNGVGGGAVVNTTMKLRVPWNEMNLLNSWGTTIFSTRTSLHGFSQSVGECQVSLKSVQLLHSCYAGTDIAKLRSTFATFRHKRSKQSSKTCKALDCRFLFQDGMICDTGLTSVNLTAMPVAR